MNTPCILGIDPGLTGALAFYFPDAPAQIAAEDMPCAGGEVDAVTLARLIKQMHPTVAAIERVASMPGQGVVSTFRFGCAYGVARGVVLALGVPLHVVSPRTWKGYFRLDSDKDRARARALQLWPTSVHFSRKRDHNRAEAALIARYCAEVLVALPIREAGHG